MISIKKYLSLNTEAEQTLMHVVQLFVQGIGQHVISVDAEETAAFRKKIESVTASLAEEISPAELLVRAGSVVQALEDHAGRTNMQFQLRTTELQHMVKMLAATVSAISSAGETNVGRLSEIEKQVASASALDDVRTIKARLADCLSDIRKETERQQKETGATIERLTEGLCQARGAAPESPGASRDEVTGLPSRADAEGAMAEPAKPGAQTFVAVLVLERLQVVNGRFGKGIGDEILAEFARLVRKNLRTEDRLYRWGGPTVVALLTRTGPVERARSEVAAMMEAKWEHNIQTASRTILLPLTARWVVMPLMAAPRLLYHKIDVFASAASPHD